ncbi:MAG TPA: PQQ-binding-like beta-propeller repeat protein [Kineosporiaceae bacterium]
MRWQACTLGALAASLALAGCGGDVRAPTSTAATWVGSAEGRSGGLSSTGSSPSTGSSLRPASSTGAAPGWPTYHGTLDRAGAAAGVPATHTLAVEWNATLDGAVYGQPLVLGGTVVAATEQDSVYALDLATGVVRWHASLGTPVPRHDLPCGNIDPLGITGTPAVDAASGQVFVVAETTGARHDLVALDAATGAVRRRTSLDVTNRDRTAQQQRGALAVANGRVYVPFGGLDGDCGNYVGYLTATPVTGDGPTTHYEVPTSREGGIWAPSGVAVDAVGDVWVAVGNGERTGDPYDGSDSVLRLAPDLGRRLDFFAPSTWGSENAEDADLGSSGPLLLDRNRVLISGKTADVYLLDATRLGGIGGQVAQVHGCRGFGGGAWDAGRQAAFLPCTDGVLRVDVGARSLTAGWRAPRPVNGSPVLGGGTVFTLAPAAGTLHALAEDTGAELASARVGSANRFASPTLVGDRVLVPSLAGVTSVRIR